MLSNHCYSSPVETPSSLTIDFEANWQWDVGSNVFNTETTQDGLDNLICNIQVTSDSNIPA